MALYDSLYGFLEGKYAENEVIYYRYKLLSDTNTIKPLTKPTISHPPYCCGSLEVNLPFL